MHETHLIVYFILLGQLVFTYVLTFLFYRCCSYLHIYISSFLFSSPFPSLLSFLNFLLLVSVSNYLLIFPHFIVIICISVFFISYSQPRRIIRGNVEINNSKMIINILNLLIEAFFGYDWIRIYFSSSVYVECLDLPTLFYKPNK